MTHPLRFGLKNSGQDTTIEALRTTWRIADEAGFDHVHVDQVGPDQEGFFRFYESEILPRLRREAA